MQPSLNIKFSEAAVYQIKVQGHLEKSWHESFGNMTVNTKKDGANNPITELVGEIQDQAELSGILNTIYEMHLVIISINCLADNS